jgi:hypothetical protein
LKIKNIESIPVAAILVTSFSLKVDATTIAIRIKADPIVYVAKPFFVRRVRWATGWKVQRYLSIVNAHSVTTDKPLDKNIVDFAKKKRTHRSTFKNGESK